MPQSHRWRRSFGAIALVMGGAVLAGAARPGAKPTVRTVVVTTHDFAFDAPDTLAAGPTEIRLHNMGPSLHHVFLVRLEDGKTLADLMAQKPDAPPPAWTVAIGGPNTPAPMGWASAIVDLAPGRYAMLCVIPAADGMPHMMKGMAKEIIVAGPASKAAMPSADISVTLQDYSFTFSKPLSAGKHLIRLTNKAGQDHEMLLARLAPGKTPQDLLAWIAKPDGPPPGEPIGGVSPMAPGHSIELPVDLTAGKYALICFVPDAKDGQPHFAHGMVREIDVK